MKKRETVNLHNLAKAAMVANAEILARWAAGELTEEHRMLAAKGAKRFWKALASGDVALQVVYDERREVCGGCPSMQVEKAKGCTAPSAWCGPALTDRMGEENPTCGCLLAAKAAVASEQCPQGRWSK